jgi:isopenicillin-N epimerase
MEFDWQGTLDPTPWLAVPAALRVVASLVDGGWPAVFARNRELTIHARDVLAPILGAEAPSDAMLGSIVALAMPTTGPLAMAGRGSSPLDTDPVQDRLLTEHGIEIPIYPWPVPAAEPPAAPIRLIRVSSALHNGLDDVDRLAAALAAVQG